MFKYDLTIVIPTLGRKNEVRELLSSIFNYPIKPEYSIEIVLVDQNYSDLLYEVVAYFSQFHYPISHCKVLFRGLSRAKNYGAQKAQGKYICFVDDDAEFLEGTINSALRILDEGNLDAVSGRCVDREGNNSVLKFEGDGSILSLSSFENRFVESTMFFKHDIFNKFHYDENMGVGAFYGAEEGYDLIYRLLLEGYVIRYEPQIMFYHPQTVVDHSSNSSVKRAFSYRMGLGYLCRKHKLSKKFFKRLMSVVCYIPYLCVFKPKEVRYYFGELLGLLAGRFI